MLMTRLIVAEQAAKSKLSCGLMGMLSRGKRDVSLVYGIFSGGALSTSYAGLPSSLVSSSSVRPEGHVTYRSAPAANSALGPREAYTKDCPLYLVTEL